MQHNNNIRECWGAFDATLSFWTTLFVYRSQTNFQVERIIVTVLLRHRLYQIPQELQKRIEKLQNIIFTTWCHLLQPHSVTTCAKFVWNWRFNVVHFHWSQVYICYFPLQNWWHSAYIWCLQRAVDTKKKQLKDKWMGITSIQNNIQITPLWYTPILYVTNWKSIICCKSHAWDSCRMNKVLNILACILAFGGGGGVAMYWFYCGSLKKLAEIHLNTSFSGYC